MRRIIQTISLLLALPSTAENSLENQINRLILALGKSNCQFIRNNKVYTAEESVVHIKKNIITIGTKLSLSTSLSSYQPPGA